MDALSRGFASHVTEVDSGRRSARWEASEPPDPLALHDGWLRPVLQIVDIQLHCPVAAASVREGTPPADPPRFYLGLSDAEGLVWGIVPPASPLHESVSNFDIEVGCCITLEVYSIVRAANRRPVVVILAAVFSSTPLSLIGNPPLKCPEMQLSAKALTGNTFGVHGCGGIIAAEGPTVEVTFRDVASAWGPWVIRVRILWKSRLRRILRPTHAPRFNRLAVESARDGTDAARFSFDSFAVDTNGDGMTLLFWCGPRHYDAMDTGDCVLLSGGTVRWGGGPANAQDDERGLAATDQVAPFTLQFSDSASISLLADLQELPKVAKREVGPSRMHFSEVREVVTQAAAGDVVSVQGLVTRCSECAPVSTKRGRVERLTLSLCDLHHASCRVEVTLWDELAQLVAPAVGSIWCFRGVVVGFFNQKKTLSSRPSSEIFPWATELVLRDGAPVTAPPPDSARSPTPQSLASVPSELEGGPSGGPSAASHVVFTFGDWASHRSHATRAPAVLLRIEELLCPALLFVCGACGADDLEEAECLECGLAATPRYFLRLIVSDGLESIVAVGDTGAGEALFGLEVRRFAEFSRRNPRFESMAALELVGQPLLARLRWASDGTHLLLRCDEGTNVADCSTAILTAIEQLTRLPP